VDDSVPARGTAAPAQKELNASRERRLSKEQYNTRTRRFTDPRSTLQPTLYRVARDHVDCPDSGTECDADTTVREGVHACVNPAKDDRDGV
jgi:hypothetical protein